MKPGDLILGTTPREWLQSIPRISVVRLGPDGLGQDVAWVYTKRDAVRICEALAHAAVRRAQRPERRAGLKPGSVRADMGGGASAPNQSESSAQTILAQMQAMKGIGPFAQTGSLPSLIAQVSPQYIDTQLQGIGQYLNGSNGTPGMLSLQENTIQPALSRLQTAQRTADINDVATLGPQAYAAQRAFNPAVTNLLDTLTSQAQGDLALGTNLDPSLLRQAQQSVRSRYAGTLGSTGGAGDLNEALGVSAFANDLRNQRRQFASGVASQVGGYYSTPFERVLGRSSPAATMSSYGQAAGGTQSATSPVYSAFDLNSGLNLANYQGNLQAELANAQNKSSTTSGLIGGGMSALGALAALAFM